MGQGGAAGERRVRVSRNQSGREEGCRGQTKRVPGKRLHRSTLARTTLRGVVGEESVVFAASPACSVVPAPFQAAFSQLTTFDARRDLGVFKL